LNNILNTFYFASVFSPILTILFFFLINRSCSKTTRLTVILLPVLSLLSDLTSGFLFKGETTIYIIFHLYTLFTGLVYLMYFTHVYERWKKYFLALIFVFVCVCIVEFFYDKGYQHINVVSNTFLSIMVFVLAFTYFFKAINELKYPRITDDIHFYFNFAFLFYFGTTFFFVLFEPYIRSIDIGISDYSYYSYYVLLICNIVFNLIISTGIWLTRRISY
jgi:hypothetical protein